MKPKPDRLWTIDDVAEFCRVKPSVVRYWTRTGQIPHMRLGRQIRFDPKAIKEWLESKERQPFLIKREQLRRI